MTAPPCERTLFSIIAALGTEHLLGHATSEFADAVAEDRPLVVAQAVTGAWLAYRWWRAA